MQHPCGLAHVLHRPHPQKEGPTGSVDTEVALLSCVGMVPERLICARIQAWAESDSLLPESQAGFRPGRSIEDVLILLVQEAFDNFSRRKPNSRTLCVSVDFRAAYDVV